MRRTFSKVSDNTYYTPSDRIARNYTPTAQGLTMKTLQQTLAGRAKPTGAVSPRVPGGRGSGGSGGSGGISGAAGAGGMGKSSSTVTLRLAGGSPAASSAGAGASATARLSGSASMPSLDGTFRSSTTSFPAAVRTLPVSPARPRPGAKFVWQPRPEDDSEDTGDTTVAMTPRTRTTRLSQERGRYWAAVTTVAPDEHIAELNREWEDNILYRLALGVLLSPAAAPLLLLLLLLWWW